MKKIAIMQPYFFPYLGYFSLIKNTDSFILFDTVQFIRHGWIERNRVLKQNEGWQYIAVPLQKHSRDTLIKDIKINNTEKWKDKIFAQLTHYKKKSPFYKETIDVLKQGLDIDTDSITQLNYSTLGAVCKYLGITFNCQIYSEMGLIIDTVTAPDEWALNICKSLGDIDEYWNPEGGVEFFETSKYTNAGINIKFIKHNLPYYSQRRGEGVFEPGLSIVDVLMFNPPEKIREMLDYYELV